MTEVKTSKTLQGTLIDIQMLSTVHGAITKTEQVERLCRIREIAERAIKADFCEAVTASGQ